VGNRQITKPARIAAWDTPRLLEVIDFFGSIPGGEIQMGVDELVKLTGIAETAFKRYTKWACRYGAIEITRRSVYGEGRKPNLYRSIIGLDEWMEVGEERVKLWRDSAPRIQVHRKLHGGHADRLSPVSYPVGGAWTEVR
jgi:hypothetical protein